MPFNGSGVFIHDAANYPAVADTLIEAEKRNNIDDDIATGLSTCITKDGQTTVTADLPMATYKHTNVGNAAARNQYAAAGQVQDGKLNWVDGAGTADAITATYSPAITELVDGQMCCVRATAANATTTPTFAPNGLTARTIVKNGGEALVAGDISGDGHELLLRYDLANTRWELLNPKTTLASLGAPNVSTTELGYLDGVTSAIQTQLDAKAPIASPTFTGLITTAGQVKFPATQSASADANTLDDYEEGTWTPALEFNGGSTGITYSTQEGYYTKIGRLVILTGRLNLSNKGSSTGNAAIDGLPFSPAHIGHVVCSVKSDTVTYTGTLNLWGNGGILSLVDESYSFVTNADFTNISGLYFVATYFV